MCEGNRNQYRYLYKTARWLSLREDRLARWPLCAYCLEIGRITGATVVDHKKPHKGDEELFFDPDNHQSLCKHCHDSHKQAQERGGGLRGGNAQGIPIDPNHHWN